MFAIWGIVVGCISLTPSDQPVSGHTTKRAGCCGFRSLDVDLKTVPGGEQGCLRPLSGLLAHLTGMFDPWVTNHPKALCVSYQRVGRFVVISMHCLAPAQHANPRMNVTGPLRASLSA